MKLVTVVAAFGLALGASASEYPSFADYVAKFGKNYEEGSSEYFMRKFIYETELEEIMEHNLGGKSAYQMGVNKFTDLTPEERSAFRGHKKNMGQEGLPFVSFSAVHEEFDWGSKKLPKSVDWRTTKYLAPVKNQGACGSCWAFSATTNVESIWAIANDAEAPILAPQELVDCVQNPKHCGGKGGCEGATAQIGFGYVQEAGMTTMANYPYTATDDACKAKSFDNEYKIDGFINIPKNNSTALMAAVAHHGPISISVDASQWSSYAGGIYDGCNLDADIDHAVILVGYTEEYWIVRNSWGPEWGEKGYIYLKKYDEEPCGVDSTPGDGAACEGDNTPVKVCGMCGILNDSATTFIRPRQQPKTGAPEDNLVKF